jgi:hypothetical protein
MERRRCHSVRSIVATVAIVGLLAPVARADSREPDVSDARGTTVTIVEPSGFDWGDAGVGAAGAVGLMLLGAGVVLVRRHSPAGGQRSEAHRG